MSILCPWSGLEGGFSLYKPGISGPYQTLPGPHPEKWKLEKELKKINNKKDRKQEVTLQSI